MSGPAECRLGRDAESLRFLADERILTVQVVRHVVKIGPCDFFTHQTLRKNIPEAAGVTVGRIHRERRHTQAGGRRDEVGRLDVGLGQVQRVVDDPGYGQDVFVARVVRDDLGLASTAHRCAAPSPT